MLPIDDVSLSDIDFDVSDLSLFGDLPSTSPESGGSLSMEEIEQLLMNDGDIGDFDFDFSNDFLSDILLDAPVEPDRSAGVVEELPENVSSNSEAELKEDKDEEKRLDHPQLIEGNRDSDGPVDKKLNRQLRNRDAAMRSRERRKSYVKELEMKSRYFEGECRRLGMLFHSCMAENQALRLSLQNAKVTGAFRNYKQESAVLLLESLLLGSLLWFLGIISLLIPSRLPKSYLEATHLPENEGKLKQTSLDPRKPGSEGFGLHFTLSSSMSKRCKASRWRMKPGMELLALVSLNI